MNRLPAYSRTALLWTLAHARSLLALASFLAIAVGCWLFHPGLGLIVPGLMIWCSLLYTHLHGGR